MAANFENMTVKALRELARAHVGPGFSNLKTKSALVAALRKIFAKEQRAAEAAAKSDQTPIAAPQVPPVLPAPPPEPALAAAPPQKVQEQGEADLAARTPEPAPEPPEDSASVSEGILSATERELVQAYGKARAQRSDPFFLDDALAGALPYEEALGELPQSYDEESLVLLVKGPYALYLYWDFSSETVAKLHSKMERTVTCLRLFADDQMVRELECTLNDRSWYFHGLQPGLSYRVELVAISPEGDATRIGPSSNRVQLPSDAPSPLIDDRFIRLPFDVSSTTVAQVIQSATCAERRELPPLSRTLRSILYQASVGPTPRGFGASDQHLAAHTPAASSPSSFDDDESRRLGLGEGLRSSGPWSGSLLDAWGSRPSSDTVRARREEACPGNDAEGDSDTPAP
ncbi:MAG: DUF4912 domain-containing protein [Myxococcales bacterium]|jgi:hypothetical protein|nr:DUF4912 domain-containing protein [Myxococcales bacterium]